MDDTTAQPSDPDVSEADQSADQSDRIKPWTIKGIAPESRNAAIAAAERDGLTLGDWFTRNIPAIIQHNRQQNRLPVAVPPSSDEGGDQVDLAEISALTSLVQQMREASDVPPPRVLASLTYGLIRKRLRALKGERPTKTPAPSYQPPGSVRPNGTFSPTEQREDIQ